VIDPTTLNLHALIDVQVELSKARGWEPVYCVSVNQQEQLKQLFPSAIYHDTHQTRYARPAPEFADMPSGILDQPTAEARQWGRLSFGVLVRLLSDVTEDRSLALPTRCWRRSRRAHARGRFPDALRLDRRFLPAASGPAPGLEVG